MASQSTKPSLLEQMIIQLSVDLPVTNKSDLDPPSPNGDTVIRIPTFVYSDCLPTSRDDSDPTTFSLSDLAERVYRGETFSVEKSVQVTCFSWCSIMTFDTDGDCVVSFALQLRFTPEFQKDKDAIVMNYVEAFCSLVEWRNRLVLPIDPEGRIVNTGSTRLERKIGETSETKTREWMEGTARKVHESFENVSHHHPDPKSHEAMTGASASYNVVCEMIQR
ncbi:hypothetical protein FSARC_11946 [Fusarium sarcochroum]|uniref:Uncharacterized protein n=1 Tax=Fusarium sarcochroum TaxID=1208366 RepID=A0A8H4WZ00_9HYPO|nr:hypothetical protein FSARC_11946 [Fusarium sarcochroum]